MKKPTVSVCLLSVDFLYCFLYGVCDNRLLAVRDRERHVDRVVADTLDIDQHIQEGSARHSVALARVHTADMILLVIVLAVVHVVLGLDDPLDQLGRAPCALNIAKLSSIRLRLLSLISCISAIAVSENF